MLSMVRIDEPDSGLAGARLLWLGAGGWLEEPGLVRILRALGVLLEEVSSSVDAVLLNADVPGVEAVIRRCAVEGLPVIAISGEGRASNMVEALAAGADEVLSAREDTELSLQRIQSMLRRVRREAGQREQIAHLRAYLPAPASRPHGAPERLTVSLLFSDLRGFTAASAAQDAGEVFNTINQIIAAQIERIQALGGYVDGFSGDGLLALFEGSDSAIRACQAAAAILEWAADTAIGPWSQMPVAMGLHRGEVVRGDLGGSYRRVFTALGSPINVAARLCGVAAAREAVVSQELIASLSSAPFAFGAQRQVALKGIPAPLQVQTLMLPRR